MFVILLVLYKCDWLFDFLPVNILVQFIVEEGEWRPDRRCRFAKRRQSQNIFIIQNHFSRKPMICLDWFSVIFQKYLADERGLLSVVAFFDSEILLL